MGRRGEGIKDDFEVLSPVKRGWRCYFEKENSVESLGDEFGGWGLLFEVLVGYRVEKPRKQLERDQAMDESHLHRWMRSSQDRGRKMR